MKQIKQAIAHSDGTPNGVKTAYHNINWEQWLDKSGSPAELFLHRAPRFPGLATIPHKLIDSSEERKKRDEGRSKMIEKINKNLREPDIFKNGEIVYIQDNEGKWTIRVMVINIKGSNLHHTCLRKARLGV